MGLLPPLARFPLAGLLLPLARSILVGLLGCVARCSPVGLLRSSGSLCSVGSALVGWARYSTMGLLSRWLADLAWVCVYRRGSLLDLGLLLSWLAAGFGLCSFLARFVPLGLLGAAWLALGHQWVCSAWMARFALLGLLSVVARYSSVGRVSFTGSLYSHGSARFTWLATPALGLLWLARLAWSVMGRLLRHGSLVELGSAAISWLAHGPGSTYRSGSLHLGYWLAQRSWGLLQLMARWSAVGLPT